MKDCECDYCQPARLTRWEKTAWLLMLMASATITVTGIVTIIGWVL